MPSHRLSSKRSIIWRGDLVRSRLFQSAYSENRADVLPLVVSLGFTAEFPIEELDLDRSRLERIAGDLKAYRGKSLATDEPVAPQKTEPILEFWVPTVFQSPPWNTRTVEPVEERETDANDAPHTTPVMRVPHRPLATWSQLRTRLQPLLTRSFVTRKIDEKKLVQRLCRCESISELPRLVRKRSPEQVHVIADRSDRCIPFFADQELVSDQIGRELSRNQCRFSVGKLPFLLSPANAKLKTHWRGPSVQEDDLVREEPSPWSTVLILGDLAVLERHKRDELASWVQCCRKWRQRGVTLYALLPMGIDALPRELVELVVPIAWQGNAVDYATGAQREALIHEIFVRSYPALRLEPGLLRELRRMVPEAMDGSLESDVWQHDWLASNHVDGARNDRREIKERLCDAFEQLDDATRRWVLSTQRRFRMSTGFRSLWQLEFLNQTPRSRRLLPEYRHDREAMQRTLKEYGRVVESKAIPSEQRDQIVWYARRASEPALRDPAVGRSVRLLQKTFQEEAAVHSAARADEAEPDGVQRSITLEATAGGITVATDQKQSLQPQGLARSVTLESTSRLIEVHVPEADLLLDRERAFWKSGTKPDWVSDYGTDEYGAWCEFQVRRYGGDGMVTQRLRWIPPGEFMMGSPEREEGRLRDEGPQHLVRLTTGYWLADTQVTQELWEAISGGEKPSHFKGDTRPVERVSWDDCQTWLGNLKEHHGSIEAFLPSEAQWEYACRAGTQTAYSFGDDRSELSKYAWYVENSRGETHPVKQLKPNAWGLYDMHGNVWEWCNDWYDAYASTPQTDPAGPVHGPFRVCRGGGYWGTSRYCRSAYRNNFSPGNRLNDLGFRLALGSVGGAEPSEGASTPAAEPGVERARKGSVPAAPRPVRRDSFWKSGSKPEWVSDYGKDTNGLWCEFQVPRYGGDGLVTQRLRWIPPGEFMMGSPESEKGRADWEGPQHHVTLTTGYWLADTQVTQELWSAISGGANPSHFKGDTRPVEDVSWNNCQTWLKKLNDRYGTIEAFLPTEAQWEYACRAGTQTSYSFGDDPSELSKYAWYGKNSKGETHPVKQLLPNAWGLYDMHGNVWEWCNDWFEGYPLIPQTDPTGPVNGSYRVNRGGSYGFTSGDCRSADRNDGSPDVRLSNLGFRLALGSVGGAEPSEGASTPAAEPGVERVRTGSALREYTFLRSLDLDGLSPRELRDGFAELDFGSLRSVRVVSDRASYQFDRITKPAWAVDFGSDEYGLYATFEVQPVERRETKKGRTKRRSAKTSLVRQRLRWIPPGRFLMGSPEGEAGRDHDEIQHWVNITHGYWMFDTPCTQALWECVMGANPSFFKDPERPVEQVTWNDVSQFVSRLHERLPQELRFRLPTEAEWEYACRAGTTTATYAGDLEILGDANAPVLDAIAWYGGNSGHEYDLSTTKSLQVEWLTTRQYQGNAGGARKVAKKAPNSWGMYDMLGNVMEWCRDWYDSYDRLEKTDPVGPAKGAKRVLRGGGWIAPANKNRSAFRGSSDMDHRSSYVGFRLVSCIFEPSEPLPNERAAFGISNTAGWTEEQISAKLHEVKKFLDWDKTDSRARKWWQGFEDENPTRKALLLRVAEELAVRSATIAEFFRSYAYSFVDNIQANLDYLDYTRLKNLSKDDRWAGWAPKLSASGLSNTVGWSEEQLRTRLSEVKEILDWRNTTGNARKWWLKLETENEEQLSLVLQLTETLAVRKATITEFFLAWVYSNTDNVQANLHYLDYSRLKKEEEKKKAAASASQTPSAQTEPELPDRPASTPNSGEVTFVRCPSCKNLTPEDAMRCRICNNPLSPRSGADGPRDDNPT